MEQNCHRWYYVNLIISKYLSCNRKDSLAIDGTEILSTGFIAFSNNDTSNIPNMFNPDVNLRLVSQIKFYDMFSDPESDHIFSQLLVTYLVYFFYSCKWIIATYEKTQNINQVRTREIWKYMIQLRIWKHVITFRLRC